MTLKCIARSHNLEGVKNTPSGGLTVEFPMCPHPGQNILKNWREAGAFMYAMFPFLSFQSGFCLFLSMQTRAKSEI